MRDGQGFECVVRAFPDFTVLSSSLTLADMGWKIILYPWAAMFLCGRLFRVFGAGGFAECGELRVEELGGEGAGEGFYGFALLWGQLG